MSRLTPAQALAACDLIVALVKPTNPYDLSEDFVQDVAATRANLSAAQQAQGVAEASLRAKVSAKDVALGDARATLALAIKTALASKATDTQLHDIGMARPAKPVRPVAIPVPDDLMAKALVDSRTRLSFGRGGAAYGATFEVFHSPDGVNYAMVATTTKTSIVLDGQPAGQAAWYKVRAARSGLLSPFS